MTKASTPPYLNPDDMNNLIRLESLFDDGEGWDLPTKSMHRLAELGAIRHQGGGHYSITAFGRLCLGCELSRLPLETANECNSRLQRQMEARNAMAAQASAAPSTNLSEKS